MITTERTMVAEPVVYPDRVRGRRVAVLGLARSGLAACDMLVRAGAEVRASDRRDDEPLRREAERLRREGVWVELGGHSEHLLHHADFVIPSPGIPSTHPLLLEARRRGVPIFSEIEVAFWLCGGDVLALTGTNGKTTTATLLHRMLRQAGLPALLAGNVGVAFSSVASGRDDPVVLEVSSYQLEHIETFRPAVSALLNVTPDHLERHGDLTAYAAAKYRIAENQGEGDTVVLNADCPLARRLPVPDGVKSLFFSANQFLPEGVFCDEGSLRYRIAGAEGELVAQDELLIPGVHNRANAAAAAAMALAYDVPPSAIAETLRRFEGVPHRIESLGVRRGRRVYNDSKATNVGAMMVALASVDAPIVLLVGGRHKGDDPAEALSLLSSRVRAVVAYGESRQRWQHAWEAQVPVTSVDDLRSAVLRAFELSREGDAVLLSPACASFDQFRDFEDRGDTFRRYVDEITA